jgi:hypothetical protein
MVCQESAIDSCHVRVGGPPENHFIPDPPPPPIVKKRMVGGVRKTLTVVHPRARCWIVEMSTSFNELSGPPPPPPLKAERSGGSRIISQPWIRGANASTVQICFLVTHHSGPPPPPVKGRMVGGVQNHIPTIDLSVGVSVIHLCALFNLPARNHFCSGDLGLRPFCGFARLFLLLTPWGSGNILSNFKDMNRHRSSCMFY